MPAPSDWPINYEQEITQARHARSIGNEGMARVCARRAAGIVIGEYLHREGLSRLGPSAYQRLKLLEATPNLDARVKLVAGHFLLSVDKEHKLPDHIDLLSEAQWLAHELLGME